MADIHPAPQTDVEHELASGFSLLVDALERELKGAERIMVGHLLEQAWQHTITGLRGNASTSADAPSSAESSADDDEPTSAAVLIDPETLEPVKGSDE